jgi:transcriptional regulator with XRE-family HTH domain/8-oxo-dGTP pyrophosphatase MutT (NUDIX family)
MRSVENYGVFLANLRNSAGLSLEMLARCVDSSKSALSRLENGDAQQPFKGPVRKIVIHLAELLCTSRKETERYLHLAGIDVALLTEVEEFQLGYTPRLNAESSEETATLQRWERTCQQLIQQLKTCEVKLGTGNVPLQIRMKMQDYTYILQEIQRKLNRLVSQGEPKSVQVVHQSSVTEEGKVIVGIMYGRDIGNSQASQSLYTLASQKALGLMQRANIDCFAVDDLITLTQSSAFAGWDRDDIFITKLSTPLPIPQDIEALRQEKLPVIQKSFINSSHYRLAFYTPAFSDRRGLEVTLAPLGFHDFYTLIPFLDEPLLVNADGSKTSIREKYGDTALTYSTTGISCLVPAPVSLQCVIVTKDHQIILTQRSSSVAFYPNHWSASFEETMDSPGLSPKGHVRSGDDDFFACAIRGLEEEFGVPAEAVNSIKMLSLNVEYLILAVGVVAIINVYLTSQEIKTHWLVQAPDKNEASKLAAVPTDLSSIVEKMFSSDMLWHPTSRMRLIQYLFHTYGVDEVANIIKTMQPS